MVALREKLVDYMVGDFFYGLLSLFAVLRSKVFPHVS